MLVVIRPGSEDNYECEVWLGDEAPAYSSSASTVNAAKLKVQRWLGEALS